MRATTLRRGSARVLLLLVGAGASATGLVLTSLGVYQIFDSSDEAPIPSLASQHRTDPARSTTARSARSLSHRLRLRPPLEPPLPIPPIVSSSTASA